MSDDLTLDELAHFRELGADRYQTEVLCLFMSGRAAPEHWLAMARAVMHVSESSEGAMVASIDRAILRHVAVIAQSRSSEKTENSLTFY